MSEKYAYEFGKRWDRRVPRFAIARIVDKYHVAMPDDEITADIRTRIEASPQRDQYSKAIIRQSLAYALECHKRNQGLYRRVVSGRI